MEGKVMVFWIAIIACFWQDSMSHPNSDMKFQSFLRNRVDEMGNPSIVDKQINGPNGYCMNVENGYYDDGTPIVLYPCSSQPSVDELWTFETDLTIRSNGKCLAANYDTQGSIVVISSCNSTDEITWEFKNGAIVNRASRLALTAMSGEPEVTLTIERNLFSSFQTWRVDYEGKAWRVANIKGYDNSCLQAVKDRLFTGVCDTRFISESRWLMYSDGTIRPMLNKHLCISYDNIANKRVLLLSCGLGPSSQRWLYTNSSTFLNERVGLIMVMDVRQQSEQKDVVVWTVNGSVNQKWSLTYFE